MLPFFSGLYFQNFSHKYDKKFHTFLLMDVGRGILISFSEIDKEVVYSIIIWRILLIFISVAIDVIFIGIKYV